MQLYSKEFEKNGKRVTLYTQIVFTDVIVPDTANMKMTVPRYNIITKRGFDILDEQLNLDEINFMQLYPKAENNCNRYLNSVPNGIHYTNDIIKFLEEQDCNPF